MYFALSYNTEFIAMIMYTKTIMGASGYAGHHQIPRSTGMLAVKFLHYGLLSHQT